MKIESLRIDNILKIKILGTKEISFSMKLFILITSRFCYFLEYDLYSSPLTLSNIALDFIKLE